MRSFPASACASRRGPFGSGLGSLAALIAIGCGALASTFAAEIHDTAGAVAARIESYVIPTESRFDPAVAEGLQARLKARQQASNRSGLIRSLGTGFDPFLEATEGGNPPKSVFPRRSRAPSSSDGGATYRTLCVRMCDGYYWPISFATGKGGLAGDEAVCESSCGATTRLFYYPNPGGTPDDAVDLKGQRYASLPTAYLYRSSYVSACQCRPDPWEAASLERHRKYAELKQTGKLAAFLKSESKKLQKLRKNGRDLGVSIGLAAFEGDATASGSLSSDFRQLPMVTTVTVVRMSKKSSTKVKVSRGGTQSASVVTVGSSRMGLGVGKTAAAKSSGRRSGMAEILRSRDRR
jgi:hypothetical protein